MESFRKIAKELLGTDDLKFQKVALVNSGDWNRTDLESKWLLNRTDRSAYGREHQLTIIYFDSKGKLNQRLAPSLSYNQIDERSRDITYFTLRFDTLRTTLGFKDEKV